MKVLITGFDPFGGESVNPALEAVKALPDTIAGAEIIKLEIPTVFRKSLEKIEYKIFSYSSNSAQFEQGTKPGNQLQTCIWPPNEDVEFVFF